MTKNGHIKEYIRNILSDGKPHDFKEIFDAVRLKFPDETINEKRMSNILCRIRAQSPEIKMIKKGVYQIRDTSQCILYRNMIEIRQECLAIQEALTKEAFDCKCVEQWMKAKDTYNLVTDIISLINTKINP